jgi:AAA+ superfamily predicted ATPase
MTALAVTALAAVALTARRQLTNLIRARYSIVQVVSHEESRVEAEIRAVAQERGLPLSTWGCSRGWTTDHVEWDGEVDPIGALRRISEGTGRGLYVLRDFHVYLQDPTVRRWLRDLAVSFRALGRTIVILSPVLDLPPDLAKDVAVIDWPLPTREELGELFDGIAEQLKNGAKATTLGARESVVEAALGLTVTEADNAFARSCVESGRIDVPAILASKRETVRKSGVLSYEDAPADLDSVGGLGELKTWALRRRKAFSPEARAFGVDVPKGILLLGGPGTGKTLVARAISASWRMPLLGLSFGNLLGSLVGESEGKFREAIRMAEAIAPCVLWIDEIEKGVSGAGTDSSGVTTRILGALLTWMSDKTAPVYVVATANDVSGLPPELLRKGRFDEIWYVDLPGWDARIEILRVHLAKRGRDASRYDLAALSTMADGFVGAEIEAAIVEALCVAFDRGTELTEDDLRDALRQIVPLSSTAREKLDALRAWAKGRARDASVPRVAGTVVQAPPIRTLDLDEGVN